MRIASRIISVALALAGIACLGIAYAALTGAFDQKSVLVPWRPDKAEWLVAAFSIPIGISFFLAARYYFRLPEPEPTRRGSSSLVAYVLPRRREFKVIVQVGFAISLVRFVESCFGVNWPGTWVSWSLAITSIGLLLIGAQIGSGRVVGGLDWNRISESIRPLVKFVWNAIELALWIPFLLFWLSHWRDLHHQILPLYWQNGFTLLLFGYAALFLAYGKIMAPDDAAGSSRDASA